MASGRPSQAYRCNSGGKFSPNNVDGTIVSTRFGVQGNGVMFYPTIQVDGAEPVELFQLLGNTEHFTVAKDGKSVTGDRSPQASVAAMRFITTLVEKGFDENLLPEDRIDFTAIEGARVRFGQEVDEKRNAKLGKRTYTGRDGKEREADNTNTIVVAYYGGGKTAAKTVTKAASKPNGKAVDQSVEEVAAETLLAILADNDGSILKSKLPTKVAVKLGAKHPMRDEVRRTIFSDEFLNSEQGWGYDSKTQTIVAA